VEVEIADPNAVAMYPWVDAAGFATIGAASTEITLGVTASGVDRDASVIPSNRA
jgi:hypothetical protein